MANTYRLSYISEGEVVRHDGRLAIVVSRCAEDRTSGSTVLVYQSGGRRTFSWDREDPEVEFVGAGRLVSRIDIQRMPARAGPGRVTSRSGIARRAEEMCRLVSVEYREAARGKGAAPCGFSTVPYSGGAVLKGSAPVVLRPV